jgi:hypothetical protein
MSKMPPKPPAARSANEKGSVPKKPAHNAARSSEHSPKPDETGDAANMKQNTRHPAARVDR